MIKFFKKKNFTMYTSVVVFLMLLNNALAQMVKRSSRLSTADWKDVGFHLLFFSIQVFSNRLCRRVGSSYKQSALFALVASGNKTLPFRVVIFFVIVIVKYNVYPRDCELQVLIHLRTSDWLCWRAAIRMFNWNTLRK